MTELAQNTKKPVNVKFWDSPKHNGLRMFQLVCRMKVLLLLTEPEEHVKKVGSPEKQHVGLQQWLREHGNAVRQRDFLVGAYLERLKGSAKEDQIIPEPEVALLDGWEGLGSSEDDNSSDFFGDDEDKPKQPKRQPSKNKQSQVPPKVPRKQPEVKNMKKQSVSPSESDFDGENEELLWQEGESDSRETGKKEHRFTQRQRPPNFPCWKTVAWTSAVQTRNRRNDRSAEGLARPWIPMSSWPRWQKSHRKEGHDTPSSWPLTTSSPRCLRTHRRKSHKTKKVPQETAEDDF